MNTDISFEQVAVIGAAGKMGSGICYLLAHEMALQKIATNTSPILHLIDTRAEALTGLCQYIRKQATKTAEKQIGKLRRLYQQRDDLVENGEIVEDFVATLMSLLRPSGQLATAVQSTLIFEAVVENEEVKVKILRELKALGCTNALFFTNTSSIPIHVLEEQAGLEGKIIGYHFYNPPVVQKLLELIHSSKTPSNMVQKAETLARQMGKTIVFSNDIAGFIGNGHFIREGLYALQQLRQLSSQHTLPGAVYIVNKTTQDLLVRPMGIFQLMDYVGIDVFRCILQIMDRYIEAETFADEFVEEMISRGVLGGQNADGSQKPGFFQYGSRGELTGVYDRESQQYKPLEGAWQESLDESLGTYPGNWLPWKKLVKDRDKQQKLVNYFGQLRATNGLATGLAQEYLRESKKIARKLVDDRVARSYEDVDTVLLTGFYHIYGITQVEI